MKIFQRPAAALIFLLSLAACHSSRKMTDNSEPFRTLRSEMSSVAAVLRIGDTIKVIYPELSMFDFGKDQIKPETKPTFVRFANILKNYPDIRILINGYTDNIGTDDLNVDLSRRRAVNAYNLLSDNGVDASRMNTTGYGPRNPLQSNATDAGRATNRRVEFMLYRPAK